MPRKNGGLAAIGVAACFVAGTAFAQNAAPQAARPAQQRAEVKEDGTISVPPFELPFSVFASPEARDASAARAREPSPTAGGRGAAQSIEERGRPTYELALKLYPAVGTKSTMGGVTVETFIPAAGIAPENKNRVLIELHGGGGTTGGGGQSGATESLPIASIGRIKVVAVDYRLRPANQWQAAVEDTVNVYRELLKTHKPENIGIFGCSWGGRVAGQAIPLMLKEKLPLPGALGIFCAGLAGNTGDSAQIGPNLGGQATIDRDPAMLADPMYTPAASKDTLKAFPPTLFLTGSRAIDMSGGVQSNLLLTEQGVKTQMVIFDGMAHGFHINPALPESQRAYKIITRFFNENLGVKPGKR